MKKNPLILTVGLLLLVVFIVLLFFGQVRQSTVVVITTFGKVTTTHKDPGLYVKWPWPIQQAQTIDQRIQNFEDKYDEFLTADSYNLLTSVYVGWRISDPAEFFPKFNGSIPEAEKAMEGLVRSAKSAVIGKHPLSDFVSTDTKQIKFEAVETAILDVVSNQVSSKNYGVEIKYLGIKKLGFPASVVQEVFKRMTSERQVLISKTQADGESEASRIRAFADSKSAEMIYNAEAQATRIRGEGQAEAAKSFAVFEQNPELANFLLKLTALEASLKDRATLIFDQHSQPFDLFQGVSTKLSTPTK